MLGGCLFCQTAEIIRKNISLINYTKTSHIMAISFKTPYIINMLSVLL